MDNPAGYNLVGSYRKIGATRVMHCDDMNSSTFAEALEMLMRRWCIAQICVTLDCADVEYLDTETVQTPASLKTMRHGFSACQLDDDDLGDDVRYRSRDE